ncbi:putative transmembrane protein [uncultured phage cr126_1]|uniref:Putative transmembrane protein n=1 Tax=uncultured phage cr126_1 TaxID=2772075 RepID=A0A7M1RYZ8_9CAUD|nr:putative transmembrane protein [uncultured phage cr126_1]QOR59637.1 putative transmembrane protein [uncultured phage cr126_1]
MANKRIIRRKNRPLNIFADGGPVGSLASLANTTDLSKITTLGQGGASGSVGMQSVGTSASGGGGFNMGSIGGIGSSVGTIVNAGLSNAQIADTSAQEEGIKAQKNMVVGASSNDELMSEWGSWNKSKDDYTWKDVRGRSTGQRITNTIGAAGQGAAAGASVGGPIGAIVGGVVGLGSSLAGWFTGNRKAKKKAKKLNQQAKEANERAMSSFELRADNIDKQNDFNLLANYSAFGGVLGGGAIDYELATKALNNKQLDAMSKFRMPSMPNSFEVSEFGVDYFAKGGNLSRDKDYGSKKKPYPMVPADDFAGPHRSYPIPTKANARDALRLAGLHGDSSVRAKVLAKYPSLRKKAFGGELFNTNSIIGGSLGSNIQNAIVPAQEQTLTVSPMNTFKDGGGIHIKKANRGKFTKYCGGKVTSACIAKGKRSSSPAVRKRATFAANARKWHADGGYMGYSYDENYAPIGTLYTGAYDSLTTHPDALTNGGVFSDGVTVVGEGGSHEENPLTGVPMGVAPDGQPNLVEEGEVIFNDYVFSNRLHPSEELLKSVNLPSKYKDNTFASIAEKINKEPKERPYDPIARRGLLANMSKLMQAQEEVKAIKEAKTEGRQFAYGGDTDWDPTLLDDSPFTWEDYVAAQGGTDTEPNDTQPSSTRKGIGLDALRYAPALGAGVGVISDLFGWTNKPDYSNADMIVDAVSGLPTIEAEPIGNYLSYNPFDRDFYINKLNQQSSATRRALQNTSGGNRLNAQAGILAADYNYGQSIGDLARQAEEYNLAQRERVESFNRGTNQYNSESALRAAGMNQQNREMKLRAIMQAAGMREEAGARSSAAKSANLTNFSDSLGDIGREEFSRNMIESKPALGYTIDRSGKVRYKKPKSGTKSKKKSKGGYLTYGK